MDISLTQKHKLFIFITKNYESIRINNIWGQKIF